MSARRVAARLIGAGLGALLGSCTAVAPQPVTIAGTVAIGNPLAIAAARAVKADIDHIDYKLLTSPGGVQVGSTFTVNKSTQAGSVFGATTTCRFVTVADGTYRITAEAFDAANASITQGGPATSANTATVSSPNVTYTAGAGGVTTNLTVALHLKDATGETINNVTAIADGNSFTGTPVGSL